VARVGNGVATPMQPAPRILSFRDRASQLLRRYGPIAFATLASQGISVLNLGLLAFLGLGVADVYAVAIQAGSGSYAGLVIGVVYLLAVGRPNFAYWTHFALASAAFSLLIGLIAFAVSANLGGDDTVSIWQRGIVFAAFGVGGSFLAAAGVRAVRAACYGRPLYMATVVVAPNLAMIAATSAVLLLARDSDHAIVMPALFWALGSAAQYGYLYTRKLERPADIVDKIEPESALNGTVHAIALLLGVITSAILPTFYLAATTQLASGATTLLFLIARVGNALISIGVNSILMVRYNWRNQTHSGGRVSSFLFAVCVVMGTAAFVMHYFAGLNLAATVVYQLAWFAALAAAPLVMREVNARRLSYYVLAKTAVDLTISSVVAYLLTQTPSATGFFAAYAISQCTTGFVCALALKDRLLAATSLAAFAVSCVVLLTGWM
jgi:hypothetical protein